MSDDELRDALAASLAEYGGFPLESLATLGHADIRADYYARADALLPLVVAYGDRRAAQALGQIYAQRDELDCPVRKAVYDGLRCTCNRPVAPIPRVDKVTGKLARADEAGRPS